MGDRMVINHLWCYYSYFCTFLMARLGASRYDVAAKRIHFTRYVGIVEVVSFMIYQNHDFHTHHYPNGITQFLVS